MKIQKSKEMTAKLAKAIVKACRERIPKYNNAHNPYETTFKTVMATEIGYDKQFFMEVLKPYILRKKWLWRLKRESFISKKKIHRTKPKRKKSVIGTKFQKMVLDQ